MNSITEILEYSFFQNAILASAFAAITCGIIGTYIVAKRMVFITGGITHASFGGIGIAYYLGFNTILGAAIFSILSAVGVESLTKKADIRNDSVIAMMWSFGMAVGIIFIFLTPGYAPNLMSYLFGSILTVTTNDIIYLGILSGIIIIFFVFFYRFILYIAFDEQFALTRRAPVKFINYTMICLIALTIVLNIKIAGIILVLSLLTIPQNAANLLTREFDRIVVLSVIIGFAGSLAGLFLSYFMEIPSGATIIFSLIILYLIIRFYTRLKILRNATKTLKH